MNSNLVIRLISISQRGRVEPGFDWYTAFGHGAPVIIAIAVLILSGLTFLLLKKFLRHEKPIMPQLASFPVAAKELWADGRMEERKIGRSEGWRDGRMEERRIGGAED